MSDYVPSWVKQIPADFDGVFELPKPEGYKLDLTPGLTADKVYLCAHRPFMLWVDEFAPGFIVGEVLRGEFPYLLIERVPGTTGYRVVGQDAALRDMRNRLGEHGKGLFPEVP